MRGAAMRRVRGGGATLAVLGALAAACSGSGAEFVDGDGAGGRDDALCEPPDRPAVPDVGADCPPGMAYVPPGEFVMGADPAEADPGLPDNVPEHVVWLSAFCLDRTEVTTADWSRCIDAGACAAPRCAAATEDRPVACVTHEEAAGFCAWAGKRLPTEAEWEKAARGGCELSGSACCGGEDERLLPWGDDEMWLRRACYFAVCERCAEGLQPVGGRPEGAGPYGHLDLMGNVMEWTADRYATDAYAACESPCDDPTGPTEGEQVVARGGDFDSRCELLSVQRRFPIAPITAYRGIGFRCARSP